MVLELKKGISLIKQIPNWKDFESILLNSSAYNEIKAEDKIDLKQISFDLWEIKSIDLGGGERHYFSNKKNIGRSVYITAA